MNKTLLLILCDFLLLTILSMWKSEKEAPPPGDEMDDSARAESVAAMGMMEQDLLDTLKYSLAEEQQRQADLAGALDETQAELAAREEALRQRESTIDDLSQNLTEAQRREQELQAQRDALDQTRAQLAEEVDRAKNEYAAATQELSQTQLKAQQSEAQSRLLQEELRRRQEEIEKKEAALAQTAQQLSETQQQVQELNVQVKMSEQEKRFLQESVVSLKGAVESERAERERLHEQAGVLAQGVSQLAESSQDLRQELRSSIPINANQLFSEFKSNQVIAQFTSLKYNRNRFQETNEAASTILVSDGKSIFALLHVENSPFTLNSNPNYIRSIEMALSRAGATLPVNKLQFLALDPRIVAVPLTPEQANQLGGKPYLTALEPFKFEQAVLVNRQGDYYGEVEFKLDADTPGFVKMQTKIFSSIFGEFSPSTGDLVFSKTGELLGVMVNRRYCALVDNFVIAGSVDVGGDLDTASFGKTLRLLNNLLSSFPGPLR